MSSLLGGGVCPLEGGWWVSAQLALVGGGEERERGDWHLNPGHLPWVTGYSMSMLSSHDQGR
jgi:hypothetical protein